MSSLDSFASHSPLDTFCVKERSFLVGNFRRKFDSWMVVILLVQ